MSIFVAKRLGLVAAVAIAVGACSPQSSAAPQAQADSPAVAQAQVPTAAPPVGTLNGRALPDFANLVEQVGPAVVNVGVVEKAHRNVRGQSSEDQDSDDPFQEFFKRFGIPAPDGGGRRSYDTPQRQGEGSGFIVSADGYILTNAHVVADADEVTVRMTDRREYPAKVIGVDRRTDVAVIKIDAKNLPVVKIGDPSKLRPGEWVLAIGSPFTFENSVTAGIVSATGRSMPGEDGLVPFIQTDVAVNPGNSGGPLFNLNGEVVGINSQIYSRSGGYMGISFAIPIDVANNVRTQLVSTGKVTRGRIGVQIQEVNAQFADAFGLDRPRGALVGQVIEGGPAEKAGIKTGDVILSVDGKPVERSTQLPSVISAIKPGDSAKLEVWRDRSVKNVSVKVDEFKEDIQKVSNTRSGGDEPAKADKLGLSVRPLGEEERKSADTRGYLLVEDVDGPAAQAGVRPGDVILGVNGKTVKSVAELRSATTSGSKTVAILLERDGNQLFLPIRIS
ncbi:MAG TPA: DegQ family serine endoprotease [Steroidobacteraceae bacterium]|jgi:serine protease Do|nr:DegQ family serine endoprotease [Steroidobacteraceae bacterium]